MLRTATFVPVIEVSVDRADALDVSSTIAGEKATLPVVPVPPVASPASASTSNVWSIPAYTSTPLTEVPSTITGGGTPFQPCCTVDPLPSSAITFWLPVSHAIAAPKPPEMPLFSFFRTAPVPETVVTGAASVACTTTLPMARAARRHRWLRGRRR